MGTGHHWVSHRPAQGRGVRAGAAPPRLTLLLSFMEKKKIKKIGGLAPSVRFFQTDPGLIKKGV